jgi:hypothetical protein
MVKGWRRWLCIALAPFHLPDGVLRCAPGHPCCELLSLPRLKSAASFGLNGAGSGDNAGLTTPTIAVPTLEVIRGIKICSTVLVWVSPLS